MQNPLTSLHEASEAARWAIAAQRGPTVLVGHSFSGMIVTDVGVRAEQPDPAVWLVGIDVQPPMGDAPWRQLQGLAKQPPDATANRHH